eukprot:CAMPEP_0172457634 /NCGR_PEP_ID=MMETSP1065-20121228/23198_1 /TAXON_ID=265537 /ORGANISM="Amphiprora paludosa, Strain CCMP125" /LENGTH=32 /DNA_ID= /DNA_START= /DNA_END= /DNA_ORIENTATION=
MTIASDFVSSNPIQIRTVMRTNEKDSHGVPWW